VLCVVFEQRLEGAVVGLMVGFVEPVEDVVSLSGPDGAKFRVGGDVRRTGGEVGFAFGDAGPDVGADGQAPAVVAEGLSVAGEVRKAG
jgi:hypothetical protein